MKRRNSESETHDFLVRVLMKRRDSGSETQDFLVDVVMKPELSERHAR